jgi:ABC-type transporter Mla maintaining outer membrane lipid asymmetry ATPase subunit MlaF
MKNPLLSLIHVYRKFGKQTVLSDIDVDFPRVGLIGLVGASGSGKHFAQHRERPRFGL